MSGGGLGESFDAAITAGSSWKPTFLPTLLFIHSTLQQQQQQQLKDAQRDMWPSSFAGEAVHDAIWGENEYVGGERHG